MQYRQSQNHQHGFTIVELAVIIAVIGMLVGFSVVAYGNWRQSAAEAEVQSDLKGVAAAMESARNFSAGYPTSLPSSFEASEGVTLTYGTGSTSSYCVNGASKKVPSVQYYIQSSAKASPQKGTC